jgi:acetoacetate decarboxylase
MTNPSFVMTSDEMHSFKHGDYMTTGAVLGGFEGIYVSWQTDPQAIKKILPAPLDFFLPVATAYVANIAKPNYAVPYLEAGIGVPAIYEGAMGFYFINFQLKGEGAMMATFLGRENGGIPKKFADELVLNRDGNAVKAYVERDGVRLIDIEAAIGVYNTPDAATLFAPYSPGAVADGCNYLFKFDFDQMPDGTTAFSNARMRQSLSKSIVHEFLPATCKVTLQSSENDPWAELPVVNVLGGGYTNLDMHLVADRTVCQVDMDEVLPKILKGKFDKAFLG